MSYQGISIKKAVNKINSSSNGWFLPSIQRPYVWGSRFENEKYICKLFDSVMRGYPIGGLILWNTTSEIPYREFMSDYKEELSTKIVEKGVWAKEDKWLVYDGQQRLQTFYSCLKYTFNGKVLIFNLLFSSKNKEDIEETGFSFVEVNSELSSNLVKMNSIFVQNYKNKINYRNEILSKKDWTIEEASLIEENIDLLWRVFVEEDKHSLTYFPISCDDESEVNEIFQRLNSGGIPLSQSDLLLSMIKEKSYDFEEKLNVASNEIYSLTGNGYSYNSYNILQILFLIVKGNVRVDPKKIKKDEISKFISEWSNLELPLKNFFEYFIYDQFRINNSSIVPRNLCIIPLIVYILNLYKKGISFRKISTENIVLMKKYFIKSQINDWNLQSYIDNFSRIINEKSTKNMSEFEFPLKEIEEYIEQNGSKRQINIKENVFQDYHWFSLKILTPNKNYQFDSDLNRRFNPEIDHIFPLRLNNQDDKYKEGVNILWNMQPIKAEINLYKLNHHPLDFFTNQIKDSNGNKINGDRYYLEYDFMPPLDSEVWKDYVSFIKYRKELMKRFFKEKYFLEIKD